MKNWSTSPPLQSMTLWGASRSQSRSEHCQSCILGRYEKMKVRRGRRKKACTSSCLLSPCRSIIKKIKSKGLSCKSMQKQRQQQKRKFSADAEGLANATQKKASSSYKPPTLNCYAWYKCFHHLASLISSVKMKEKGETKQNKKKAQKIKTLVLLDR